LVPISSRHEKCDKTCLLGKGDHDFIVHDSFVFYAKADIYEDANIIYRVHKEKSITNKGLIDEKIFALICAGLLGSRYVRPLIKKYYEINKAN